MISALTPHYFIGISVGPAASDIAERFRMKYELKEKYKVIPHAQDFHITLRYIGSLQEEKLPSLIASLRKTAQLSDCFDIAITGLSFFGSPAGPRVVYLAIEPSDALSALRQRTARRTEKILGMERDNRFVPHITIAKKRKTFENMQLMKEVIEPVFIQVNGFSLFKIHPHQSPSYETVHYFPLQKD